ncbi:MAG: CPBP family intramembrane glutamic endopeptidase [Planctomycetota bacterium]
MSQSPNDHHLPKGVEENPTSNPTPPAPEFVEIAAEVPVARPVSVLSTFRSDDPRFLLRLPTLSRRSAWFDIVFFIVAMIALEIVSSWAILQFTGVEPLDGEPISPDIKRRLIIPTVTTRAFATLVLVSVILRARRQSLSAIGLSLRRPFTDALVGFVGVGAMAALIFPTMFLLTSLFPKILRQNEENTKGLLEWLPHLHPLGFTLLMGVVGFYEEVAFRGFLMLRLRRGFGNWPLAVVMSTILFTVPHLAEQTVATQIPLFMLSLGLSILTIWRGSLIPAIVAHMGWNLGTVLILHFSMGDKWR